MLSDGAGACVLTREPRPGTLALKLQWIHTRSFSGDYPTCMRIGSSQDSPEKSYLDYSNMSEVDEAGGFLLRQDIRLLPNIFDVGISEFGELVKAGKIEPQKVDHFLCHYSSEKFSGVIKELLRKTEMEIPHDRWFSNLKTAGNTGSASIFVMLDEFLKTKTVKPGEKILCFIPESARFTSCYLMLEAELIPEGESNDVSANNPMQEVPAQAPTHATPELARTLRELGHIWHQYRSRVFRSSLVKKIYASGFSREDYLHWMSNWIPQVREGSLWMREAIASLPPELAGIGQLITTHANEEQFDFKILYDDYVKAGGTLPIDKLKRNAGGEALNSYMYARARGEKSYGLLGGIFIIEGTGQKIIPTLLPLIKKSLTLNMGAFRFLEYHGENDVQHMNRWIQGMEILHALTDSAGDEIIMTARAVSDLYSIQWELAHS
jgi:3-oxoacyl-[acyl-carrier-protein] synthase-3